MELIKAFGIMYKPEIKKEIRKRALSIMGTYRNDGDYKNGKVINDMKPYFIYYFDTESGKPSFESGHQAYIKKANSELDALKQWYIHLNGYYSNGNFFRNSTYHAVCAL